VSTQVWTATVDGRAHRVEATDGFRRRVSWWVDDELAGERTSAEEKIRVEAGDDRLEVRFSGLGAPRRASVGDVDLVPEPGSKAARHEEAVRAHPERYALVAAAGGVVKVVVPILLTVLAARLAFSLPLPSLPSLPSLPTPDLPSLPRPDLPSLPLPDLPDLPDWTPPGWVERVLDVAHYVWPVVLAYVIARAEIRRRRRQDAQRAGQDGDDTGGSR
jgi:hypothetical protein